MIRFLLSALAALILVGISWGTYRQHKNDRELRVLVEAFTAQADFIEAMRKEGLKGASPSATAQGLRNIVKQSSFSPASEFRRPGSAAAKTFQSAAQSTKYYVTNLEAILERVRVAAVSDLMEALRAKTGEDVGDDPVTWIEKYAGDNSAPAVSVGASGHEQPTTYLVAINPTASSLGAGWRSHVEFLIDPTGHPSEILGSDQFSTDTVNTWRRSSQDTNYALSGWVRSRFDFTSARGTNRYYLEIDRFRNGSALSNQVARMLTAGAAQAQRSLPKAIGEAAVVQYDRGSPTLWFNRGLFVVRVSSFGNTPADESGGSMRDLARAVDANIIKAGNN